MTEKLLHAEDEYRQVLKSAKELYGRPLAKNHREHYEIILKPLEDLSKISGELCERVSTMNFYFFKLFDEFSLIKNNPNSL